MPHSSSVFSYYVPWARRWPPSCNIGFRLRACLQGGEHMCKGCAEERFLRNGSRRRCFHEEGFVDSFWSSAEWPPPPILFTSLDWASEPPAKFAHRWLAHAVLSGRDVFKLLDCK